MARTTHVRRGRLNKSQAARIAITARLLSENWQAMTSQANTSARHPKTLSRWRTIARAANPGLNDEQIDRLAERLRTEHYAELGRRSGAARRAARRIPEPADTDQPAA